MSRWIQGHGNGVTDFSCRGVLAVGSVTVDTGSDDGDDPRAVGGAGMARHQRDEGTDGDNDGCDATCTGDEQSPTTARTLGREPSFGPGDPEELHLSGHAFERVCSEVDEAEFGTPDDIANRAADQHLAGTCLGTHTSADMHGYAAELGAGGLDLAHVNAGPDLETSASHLLCQETSARDRISRVLEDGEETIAGIVDFATPHLSECVSHEGSIRSEQLPPLAVTDTGCQLGRGHNVREQHRGEAPARASGPGSHGRYSPLLEWGLSSQASGSERSVRTPRIVAMLQSGAGEQHPDDKDHDDHRPCNRHRNPAFAGCQERGGARD
jgi:hypothetical protein